MAKSTSKLFKEEEPKEMLEDAMNLPEETEEVKHEEVAEPEVKVEEPVEDIQDIDLSAIKKKRFRINGDPNKILELNVSDLNIVSRMTSAYERLQKYMGEVGNVFSQIPDNEEEITEEQEKLATQKLDEIDQKMKKEIDYIFNAPVSAICSDGGSMYDPFEGMFRFEHIIEAISKLYERNLDKEFSKMRHRVATKTSKYVKHYHN